MPDNTEHELNIIDFSDLSPLPFENSCITIGNFDGVHRGHQAIIKCMVREAQTKSKLVLVITFFPNPSDYFRQNNTSFYLSTPKEKEEHLLELGVDDVITFRFDQEFANLTPEAFLRPLREKLGLDVLVVGHDFALGKNRIGTLPVIKTIGEELSFSVEIIPPVEIEREEISSTRIRQRLDAGDVRGAAEMLGRPYEIMGVVSYGSDRGSKIGLPTANMSHWQQKKLPAVGVYATKVVLHGKIYQGITNVGYRPTFEQRDLPSIETHILDFDGNIYGENLKLQFIQRIRDEQKFSGVEEFLAQIERDKATARGIFSHDKT